MRDRMTREDGAVIVEFAAVTVLFLLMLFGIITYGLIFAVQQTLSHAANEGARAAVAADSAGQAETLAEGRAGAALGPWTGTATAEATVDGDVVSVTTTYPYGTDPIVPKLGFLPTPDRLTGQSSLQLNPDVE